VQTECSHLSPLTGSAICLHNRSTLRLRGWRRCGEGEVAGIAAIELVRVGLEIREVTLSRGREGGLRVSLPPACPLDQARALEVPNSLRVFQPVSSRYRLELPPFAFSIPIDRVAYR
jgi:hypothetical protein